MHHNLRQENMQDFIEIYDQYAERIYNFIYYKTHHKETAEDLTSETFVKALSKFDSFDKNKGSLSSWIYRIARNTVIDFYRTKNNIINIDDVWDLSEDSDISQDFDTKEKLKEAKKYLKKLKSNQREIVILRIWEDLSYKEISLITDNTEAGCKMAFMRAMRVLRQEMPLHVLLALLLF